ncbi:hypothetical protein V2J09_020557 [Rumex salicifolius]
MEQGENSQLISRMRCLIEELGSSSQSYGDITLMRFLIARSMNPRKAAKMFVEWQKWRSEMVPLGYVPESEVPDELGSRKVYLGGLTKDGHPILIVKACKHFPSKDQLQVKKVVAHSLDKAIASAGTDIGNEKLIGILDLQQISYKNVDTRGLIMGFQLLQAYYPERLARCFILNVPTLFVRIWKAVSRFLDKATLQKVVFVSNEDEKRKFIEEIGEEVLPECYGGKAKLMAIQDVCIDT